MAAAKKSPSLDATRLMDMEVKTLQGLRVHYQANPADVALIDFVIAQHTAKPVEAAPVQVKAQPAAKPAPAPKPPKAYYQRVEVYRGRCRIKGGICREQIDNVIAQLQALKANPAVLTYEECQVQFPWDKSQG